MTAVDHGGPGALAAALALVDGFDADPVAVGVTDARRTLATHGDPGLRPRIASVTKLLTAMATWIACEEGSVALTDPVGQAGCTLEHLLAHAGGYSFDGPTPIAPPGTRRIYSNTGYQLLADHVVERTGLTFGTYVQEAVLEPLGMGDTELGAASPAKGAHSTVPDLLVLARELLAPTLVSTETHARATSVAFPGLAGVLPDMGRYDPLDWGLGPELKDHKDPHWSGARTSAGAFGHFGGTGTFLWVDPAAGIACCYLGSRDWGAWSLEAFPRLSDAVLGAVVPS